MGGGGTWSHVLFTTKYRQRSIRTPRASNPPYRIAACRVGSYENPAFHRAGGPVARRVHVFADSLYAQRSSWNTAPAPAPPNASRTPFRSSYVIAPPRRGVGAIAGNFWIQLYIGDRKSTRLNSSHQII